MELHFKELGNGYPLVILHGFLGTGDNWFTLGKRFAEHFHVYIPDQRNHGNSPHSDEFGYTEMADDLLEFFGAHHISRANLIGHSMGGKVVMEFAFRHPEMVNKLVVADISPKYYPPHHDDILAALNELNLSELKSRQDADEKLAKRIDEFGVRQFLLKNLNRDSNGFSWKMNLKVLTEQIEKVGPEIGESEVFDKPTLFIKGNNSRYIKDGDEIEIKQKFPNMTLQGIDGAGHWLHAEKPDEFYNAVMDFFSDDN